MITMIFTSETENEREVKTIAKQSQQSFSVAVRTCNQDKRLVTLATVFGAKQQNPATILVVCLTRYRSSGSIRASWL